MKMSVAEKASRIVHPTVPPPDRAQVAAAAMSVISTWADGTDDDDWPAAHGLYDRPGHFSTLWDDWNCPEDSERDGERDEEDGGWR